MIITVRGALLRTTAIAAFAVSGAGVAFAATNGVTVNGGGSTLAGPGYEAIYSTDGLSTIPNSLNSTSCPTNGSTTAYDIYYGFVGSGAGATGFINNDPTQIGCQAGLADDFGAGDLPVENNYAGGSSMFKSKYGYQLIQVPAFGTPVTIPYNLANKGTNGSLKLTDADLCGIFSGKIQNWKSIAGSGSKAGIEVSYRQDSSGTSFLLTNHLGAVCTSSDSNITFSGTTKFATLFSGYTVVGGNHYIVPSGTFSSDVSGVGSGGVQQQIAGNSNSVGYLSPDYTAIAPDPVLSAGVSAAPVVASVNKDLPSQNLVSEALRTANTSGTSATNPDSFGFLIPNPSVGYPIVGYTYIYVSSCYATAAKVSVIKTWLDSLYNVNGNNAAAINDITNGGYVPVPGVTTSGKPTVLAKTITNDYLATKAVVPITSSCTGGR